MRKMNIYIGLILFLLSIQTEIYSQDTIIGLYIGKESKRTLFVDENQNFFLLNSPRTVYYNTIDTLSYGNWRIESGYIVLNSSEIINSNVLKLNVLEYYIENFDSLVFEITNPYERLAEKIPGERDFYYLLVSDVFPKIFDPILKMNSNRISIHIPSNITVYNFYLYIIPNLSVYPNLISFNYILTNNYRVGDSRSNLFKISIPDFTYKYIAYQRFREEYLKIIDRNNLQLRGEIFKRLP